MTEPVNPLRRLKAAAEAGRLCLKESPPRDENTRRIFICLVNGILDYCSEVSAAAWEPGPGSEG